MAKIRDDSLHGGFDRRLRHEHCGARYYAIRCARTANTFPVAINNSGDLTGYFCPTVDCSQVRGFVREFKGAISVFDGIPSGINDAGTVAGQLGRLQGFLRDKKGGITVFDVPELFGPRETLTGPLAINNSGDTAGWIACAAACSEWFYGFVRDKHGLITTFFVAPQGLHPNSINARGEITGWNKVDIFQLRGFVRAARNDNVTIFEAPGARGPNCGGAFTNPTTINNGGDVAGSYNDCQIGPRHRGFVRGRDGSVTTFDAAPDSSTEVSSINERGDVTGDFFNPDGRHKFVREATGNIAVFDVPGGLQTHQH